MLEVNDGSRRNAEVAHEVTHPLDHLLDRHLRAHDAPFARAVEHLDGVDKADAWTADHGEGTARVGVTTKETPRHGGGNLEENARKCVKRTRPARAFSQ